MFFINQKATATYQLSGFIAQFYTLMPIETAHFGLVFCRCTHPHRPLRKALPESVIDR
jgi:hypothetical protein